MELGEYEYIRGAGSGPNRKIVFQGNHNKIRAQFFARQCGSPWTHICDVSETSITKEMQLTSEKVEEMIAARKANRSPNYVDDKCFNELSYFEKVEMIKKLDPQGPWLIEIISTIGQDLRFEQAERLRFFKSD